MTGSKCSMAGNELLAVSAAPGAVAGIFLQEACTIGVLERRKRMISKCMDLIYL